MRVHSLEIIKELKKCRRMGESIHELVSRFSIPKTTIWHHVHNIKLSEKQKQKIKKRQGGSKIRSEKAWENARKEALLILDKVNIHEISPIVLSTLYWAEGNKKGLVFTNTDEKMIKLFLKIMREYFCIENKDILIWVRVNHSKDAQRCRRYWQKVTKTAFKQIRVDINGKNNKSRSIYGICRIVMRKGSYMQKVIYSLNSELTSKILPTILIRNN